MPTQPWQSQLPFSGLLEALLGVQQVAAADIAIAFPHLFPDPPLRSCGGRRPCWRRSAAEAPREEEASAKRAAKAEVATAASGGGWDAGAA